MEHHIPPTVKRSACVPSNTTRSDRRWEASEGSCSCHCTGDSYRLWWGQLDVKRSVWTSTRMLFSPVEAPLRQVNWSSWHKSMRIRGEMLFTPSPGQQWELAATRTAAWGELAAPMWEKKGKSAEKYNSKCEMSSSKSLSCVLLALAGLPTQVSWDAHTHTHKQPINYCWFDFIIIFCI